MSEANESAPTKPQKGANAFRTIGEVAEHLDVPTHVLRFWETKFPQLKPVKRGGGRRYYRPEDVVLLRRIRQCLYQDGYTIRGVRQLLDGDDEGPSAAAAAMPTLFPLDAASDEPPGVSPRPARRPRRQPAPASEPDAERKTALEEIRRELLEGRALLNELLRQRKTP